MEEEVLAHKCVLVSSSGYFCWSCSESCCVSWHSHWKGICFSSDWSGLSLHGWLCQGERWAPKGWQECIFYDFCWFQVNKSEDVEVVCNILVVPQFLSRLKQICECQVWSTLYTLHSQFIDSMSNNSMFQLARLLTLVNVAELFPFFVYYLADQLQRSAMQLICLNLPALLEALTRTPGRSSTPSTGILIPCSRTGGWVLLQTFWLLRWLRMSWREPTTLERSQDGRGDVDIVSSLSQGEEESDQRKGGIRFRQKPI